MHILGSCHRTVLLLQVWHFRTLIVVIRLIVLVIVVGLGLLLVLDSISVQVVDVVPREALSASLFGCFWHGFRLESGFLQLVGRQCLYSV